MNVQRTCLRLNNQPVMNRELFSATGQKTLNPLTDSSELSASRFFYLDCLSSVMPESLTNGQIVTLVCR
jgi:hypothetical protein